jgi:hypothetical protein
MSDPISAVSVTQVITAIGALGVAASGIVDAAKTGLSFINRIGLEHITETVRRLTPEPNGVNSLEREHILRAVEANWINGEDLGRQKCLAVSLILGHMIRANSPGLAEHTNTDAATLQSIATKTLTGDAFLPEETAVQTRFQLILSTMIDEAYQRSDEHYRNGTRTLAGGIAVLLSFAGGWVLMGKGFWTWNHAFAALVVGLVAIPMAPIAKDLSTTVAAFANTLQAPKPASVDAVAVANAVQAPRPPAMAAVAAASAAPKPLVDGANSHQNPAPEA